MKALIIGAGNIGTAIAFYLSTSFKGTVALLDSEDNALNTFCFKTKNINLIHQDVFSEEFFNKLTSEYDVVISTLPWTDHVKLCNFIKNFPILLIGIARPPSDYYRDCRARNEDIKATIIHGCGLEPGLSEIFTQYLAKRFTKLDEVFIACGGIPMKPVPPLNYKLVFGGNNLPFQLRETLKIDNGALCTVPRFGEIDELRVEHVGILECWNDGLTPWLAEYLIKKEVVTCVQKTIRWPGYATTVLFLNQAGFLSNSNIDMTKKILLPLLKLEKSETDMVIQRITIKGLIKKDMQVSSLELIDYKNEETGLSAMARTTGYSAALIAKFLWNNKQLPSEMMVTDCYSDDLFDYLHKNLKSAGMKIKVNFYFETRNAK